MKKSNFVALILGVISAVFLGLGMCMTTLPEWDAFNQGIIVGVIGIVIALVDVFVWRRMEKKTPIKLNGKTVGIVLLSIVAALTLGGGMSLVMVFNNLVVGVVVGLVGIVLLLSLIPICKGLK